LQPDFPLLKIRCSTAVAPTHKHKIFPLNTKNHYAAALFISEITFLDREPERFPPAGVKAETSSVAASHAGPRDLQVLAIKGFKGPHFAAAAKFPATKAGAHHGRGSAARRQCAPAKARGTAIG
jgi:hypothetical protein